VQLVGNGNAISDSNGCPGDIGPTILTNLRATLSVGREYRLTVVRTTCGAYYSAIIGAWIDWDRNGIWETSELLFPFSKDIGTLTFNFTVPSNARMGSTRMRLQVQEISTASTTSIDPCAMFKWGDTKDYTIIVTPEQTQIQCKGDPSIKPINGVADDCLNTKNYGEVCVQRCNTGYTLSSGSLVSTCDANGRYSPSNAICSAMAALNSQVTVTSACLPDNVAPVNGGPGTCARVGSLGETCIQTCNPGFHLRDGTSLVRRCTFNGYSDSMAICE